MRYFLIGGVFLSLMLWVTYYQFEYNNAQRALIKAKFDAEEVAAAAAQFIVEEEYAQGRLVFDRIEGVRAAEFMVQRRLVLDEHFNPKLGAYWIDNVSFSIEFFDDSNTVFPYDYTHDSGDFTTTLTSPSVVVTLSLGEARMSLVPSPSFYRVAAHTWQDR